MNRYRYEGPVVMFDRCVQDRFVGETMAVNPSKARSNIAYRWKQQHNYVPGSKITLPGKIYIMEESK